MEKKRKKRERMRNNIKTKRVKERKGWRKRDQGVG